MNYILHNRAKLNLSCFSMQEMLEKNPSGQERLPMEIMPSVPSALQPNMVRTSIPPPFLLFFSSNHRSVYRLIGIFF